MSAGQRVLLCDREDNRRSGVIDCGVSTRGLSGVRKGDEHPAYIPYSSFTFALSIDTSLSRTKLLDWECREHPSAVV